MPTKVEAVFVPQENINERGELALRSDQGMTLTFDRSAAEIIADAADGKALSLVVETPVIDETLTLPEEQLEILKKAEEQGCLILDFNLVDENGVKIVFSDTEGGRVRIEIPFELPETITNPTVYYISDDGNIYEMPTVYDSERGVLSFTVSHFSYYMVGEAGLATAVEEPPISNPDEPDKTDPASRILGDVNGDGTVDAMDASEILLYAAALGAGETYDTSGMIVTNADIDGNEMIDAVDPGCA